jgi:hypothetical protein
VTIQVLEGKLALKSGAEGGSVDINMQQLQVKMMMMPLLLP